MMFKAYITSIKYCFKMSLGFLFVNFAFACHSYDKLRVIVMTRKIPVFTFFIFRFAIKLTIVFQFHSNKLCIVHKINMEGTMSQNFDILVSFKDIEK